MKRNGFILAALLLAGGGFASAQTQGGLLLDRELMTPAEMFELSQTSFNYGSARSMAMAGAFTSLGADLSSMAINPAGLGMYRRNEISITPLMTFERSSNSADAFGSNAKNRFTVGSFGFVINAYESTGTLTSLNIGIGYNRLADLNYSYSYQSTGNNGSIADVFSKLLDYSGLNKNDITGDVDWNRVYPEYWGAVLGYKTGMTDQVDGRWQPTWIGSGVDIGHYTEVLSKGSVGEYEISVGANLLNKFYIGATIGIQSVHQEKHYLYGEDYLYGGDGINPSLDYQLLYSHYGQGVVLDGAGVNFKLGFVYRPIENLRIGFAIHTPTYYSIERSYVAYADPTAHVNNNVDGLKPDRDGNVYGEAVSPTLKDNGRYSWAFTSPARMLFGISYAFGNRGLISIDYERDWYNGIRIKDNPNGLYSNDAYNDTFRHTMKGSNTVRIGAEFKPLPFMAIRAGFGYTGSMLRSNGYTFNEYDRHLVTEPLTGEKVYEYNPVPASSPMTREVIYYTAGLGFSITPNVVLDVAYQYQTTKHTDYNLFYFADGSGVNASGIYNTTFDRHAAALTLGFRF